MLIKKIRFSEYEKIEEIDDIENYNLDVFVNTKNGFTYVVTVGTLKNILSLMEKNKKDFFEPGIPFIIVKRITRETVQEARKAYAENDGYWLKLHHFAADLDMSVFERLEVEQIQDLKKLNKELDKLRNS